MLEADTLTDSTADPGSKPHVSQHDSEASNSSAESFNSDGERDVVKSAASPPLPKRPSRWDTYILFNIAIPILLLVAGFAVILLLGKAEPKPLPPLPTTRDELLKTLPVARVERIQSLEETGEQLELAIDGTVVPFREARVASEVSGQIVYKAKYCEPGAFVEKGQTLMQIDETDYQLEVERLTHLLEQEQRALVELAQEKKNLNRSIEVAEKDLAIQQKDVQRQLNLKSFASKAEVDRARSAVLQAEQQLVTLENQLDLMDERKERLEATERLAETQLRVATTNRDRCEIKAPISGVIVSEQADWNTFVSRGTQLVTIEDTTKAEVSASMRMDQLYWVLDQRKETTGNRSKEGYQLPETPAIIEYQVSGRDSTVYRWSGTLVSYDGIGIDPNTRTVPVRIVVDDPTRYLDADGNRRVADRTNALLRGMFVQVRLQLKPKTPLVVIPARALRPGNKVWKFNPDDSIVDEMVAAAKAKAEQSGATAEPTTTSAESSGNEGEQTFDSSQWSAGKVVFSDVVYPIESLHLMSEFDPSVASSVQTTGRNWICEADRSDLDSGTYVVVSPLDSIPQQGLPVRANLSTPTEKPDVPLAAKTMDSKRSESQSL